MQPGQPGGADWRVTNPHPPQPLRFRLRVLPIGGGGDGAIVDPGFVTGGGSVIFRGEVGPGQYLVCEGGPEARVFDAAWHLLRTIPVPSVPVLQAGDQGVSFSCAFAGAARPSVSVRFITLGPAEAVGGGAERAGTEGDAGRVGGGVGHEV